MKTHSSGSQKQSKYIVKELNMASLSVELKNFVTQMTFTKTLYMYVRKLNFIKFSKKCICINTFMKVKVCLYSLMRVCICVGTANGKC